MDEPPEFVNDALTFSVPEPIEDYTIPVKPDYSSISAFILPIIRRFRRC